MSSRSQKADYCHGVGLCGHRLPPLGRGGQMNTKYYLQRWSQRGFELDCVSKLKLSGLGVHLGWSGRAR